METIDIAVFIGGPVVGAIVGAIGTHLVTKSHRENKQISYIFDHPSGILEPKENIGGKLEIKYGGENIKSVYSHQIMLKNTGNVPIDIDGAKVSYFGSASILSTRISDASVPLHKIEVDCENYNYTFSVKSDFLNPGDYINIKILLNGKPTEFNPDYRMRGLKVREIRKSEENSLKFTLEILSDKPNTFGLTYLLYRVIARMLK
ncbi:hypothetical protein [Ferruginivarius sediminum]|uniref:hypothetical protein n=1 Tax=Ferruginivarius sediminum TaxID=2661937 RepID=UPI0011C0530E|nr:hypothetical protein [Ferruginivarius sediminum]